VAGRLNRFSLKGETKGGEKGKKKDLGFRVQDFRREGDPTPERKGTVSGTQR